MNLLHTGTNWHIFFLSGLFTVCSCVQLNSIQSGPNFNPADSIQNAPQAGRASSAGERQGIADIVKKAELLPAQEPRIAQSKGPRVALVLARVVGAVLSLGISEGVIAIRNSKPAPTAVL